MNPDAGVYASLGMDNTSLTTQMRNMLMEQEVEITLDHTLFSWMEEEKTVLKNDASTSFAKMSQVQSNYNFFSKCQFMENLWFNSQDKI